MSETKNVGSNPERDQLDTDIGNIAESLGEVSSVSGSVKNVQHASTSERHIKFERAQKCLEKAALVSKRIKEHRKAAAELLGKPFEDDVGDTASEMASTMSERTGYSVATDISTTLSVQEALNIPGISESLANTLKQKELLMERIKQYKEINSRPKKTAVITKKDPATTSTELKQSTHGVDIAKLLSTVKDKENALSVMQVKMRAMETTILDLQEKINEKDQIIEAKNKATTLISDSLSKKEKDSLDLLEDTKQQMTKMQQNFVAMESEWKDEKDRLLKQIEEKNEKISSLEEANTILENSRFEISVTHSKLAEELDLKNMEIIQLQQRIEALTIVEPLEKDKEHTEEEKGSLEIAEMVDLTKKVEILEQLNYQIRQTNKELENQLAVMSTEPKVTTTVPSVSTKKGSPLSHRKGGRGAKSKSPWSHLSSESAQQEIEKDKDKKTKSEHSKSEMILQSLNKEILEKEYVISQKDELISQLKSVNETKDVTISELKSHLETQKEPIVEKADVCISTDNTSDDLSCTGILTNLSGNMDVQPDVSDSTPLDIKDLEYKLMKAHDQIRTLNEEIDAANKNMIKVKSTSKLKVKQMQKTIDNFSKVTDTNAEIVRLNEELHQLSQKVAELEEEKGNLQLHLVDYDSGRLTESDVYKKLVEMENLAETRLKSISLLETQKFDLVQELHVLQQKNIDLEDKLADMSQLQNDQVCSEIKSVQLEEQLDELQASKKELELIIQNLKLDKEQSQGTIQILQEEKNDLIQKLDNYIQENIELTDKLEKLSAEKVSSAESIEIVESLTTQEKLELEEYNKGLGTEKIGDEHLSESYKSESRKCNENIETLVKQREELNEKVALFTKERQEVMDKMNMISADNESLHEKINELKTQCESLHTHIELLTEEKNQLKTLNDELNLQIEELKRERIDIMKETVEIVKPLNLDENLENLPLESHEEKSAGDRSNNRAKSVKQLTKEILKLKNTIKEREAEIADSQMKILSLEEQQEKYNELIQNSASYDDKIKQLVDENNQLEKDIITLKESLSEQEQVHVQKDHFQEEIHKLHQKYSAEINTRDTKIHELENLLKEYEKQSLNYINTLKQKDKEIVEYINQITKLNDVSQKLKSTIELLEEEKVKDQNVEVVKSLNKQISIYKKTLSDYEEKIKSLDEEKSQLVSMKTILEKKSNSLETELKNVQENITEKDNMIKELNTQQQKHAEEFSSIKVQAKEQDEEIHEIKLQLRKESIENEKLRTTLQQKDNELIEIGKNYDEVNKKVETATIDYKNINEQYIVTENKNKELMEKLKKFAINFKKKSAMFTDLETQFNELQKDLESKNQHLEQLMIQVETIPALEEKLKVAEEEYYRLQSNKTILEQNAQEIEKLQEAQTEKLQVITKLNESLTQLNRDLDIIKEENANLQIQNDYFSKKLVEYEIEQKNSSNLLTKIMCLEADINQKQSHIEELSNELKSQEHKFTQIQFAHDAKVQECDLYIENLQTEIEKYKSRIARLEETVSVMEERRHSLERKADQLDGQLQEKQDAYTEYSNQEDELVSRLAILMDHDRVIEKQLYEIENENQELQFKIQYVNEEYLQLQNTYSDLQDYCKILELKASKVDSAESDVTIYQSKIKELESTVKRLTNENLTLSAQKKTEIEELELEFNTQIENAIKDKKTLSEKYEKLCEKENLLESKLQEYRTNMENLKININDLTSENNKLSERPTTFKEKDPLPDYTDQYVAEINNLNSILNSRNEEIGGLKSKIEALQTHEIENKNNLDFQISDLNKTLQQLSSQIDKDVLEIKSLKETNDELSIKLYQKDEQIKQLVEKKRLVFEMNIPKTEGLTISSTIEELSDDKVPDMSDLMSQIVYDSGESGSNIEPPVKKTLGNIQVQQVSQATVSAEGIVEPPMIAKKSFLCYNKDEQTTEEDPFNSEEGWGVDVHDETADVTPGLSHLRQKIQMLDEDNKKLQTDFDNTNTKLLKALKKLKELKASNDMLTKELKISKQISQSSMLDLTIESEMSNNVQELERKIEELNADLAKERREKGSLKKQNEVFKDANDRLTEIKEKMDSEIELWKYNFKQANDKISTLQWGAESKGNPAEHTSISSVHSVTETQSKDELIKLERENDELQSMVDNLSIENKHLSIKLEQLKKELNNLRVRLSEKVECSKCGPLEIQLQELEALTKETDEKNIELQKKISEVEIIYDEAITNFKKEHFVLLEQSKKDLQNNISSLQEEIQCLKKNEAEAVNTISKLTIDLEDTKLKLKEHKDTDNERTGNAALMSETCKILEEKCNSFENQLENANFALLNLTAENDTLTFKLHAYEDKVKELEDKLKDLERSILLQTELDNANQSISELKHRNSDLIQKSLACEERINELEEKIEKLNTENDQLLSSVAELSASMSSAIDQRGFEIAELWKQHLAQRETDFQKIEQDLRMELKSSENKYEQLLDKMQSSSREETEKIVMVEQVTSLQNKIHEKDEHITNLQSKYADVIHQLDLMRSEMEDEKLVNENKILVQQEENEKVIQELTIRNRELTNELETALKAHENEMSTVKVTNENLNKQIEELHNDFEVKVAELSRLIQIKDSEIYQKTHEFANMLKQRNDDFDYVRTQLLEYERKIEEIGFEKESELALLRLKMHDTIDGYEDNRKKLEKEKSSLEEALNVKIIECTNLNKQIVGLNKSLEEYSNKITEMEVVLENQEIEIVTLKDEVSSLNDVIKSSSSKIEKHVTFASDTKHGTEGDNSETILNKDLLDAVPRAELDLALYMLHQRDVRCEELTMELTQLLEERDTLQLRLSDSLRSLEELKLQTCSGLDVSYTSGQDAISDLPSSSGVKDHHIVDTHRSNTSRSSSISDPDADRPKLQAKLSELRSVKQSRDVRLRHDSEQRQLGMRLLQRDVANLPPEAVDQLNQAHHTLTRDSQSTPTVLLNWLRGKSTPKVVHM